VSLEACLSNYLEISFGWGKGFIMFENFENLISDVNQIATALG
jgi:hypothetical protein